MLGLLKSFQHRVSKVVNVAVILLFVILIVSCVVQVFSRYVLNNSYRWTEELARYSFIWVHFFGTSICLRTKSHATITFLRDAFPPKIRNFVNLLISIILLVVSAVLLYGGIKLATLTNTQMSTGIKIPMSYVYVSAAFGGAISLIDAVVLIADDVLRVLGRDPQASIAGGQK
jgi:TRAP-type C4-dicarboxylate transport system permease small subunit